MKLTATQCGDEPSVSIQVSWSIPSFFSAVENGMWNTPPSVFFLLESVPPVPPATLPQLSVFFTEPRNVHKPQSRLILGCFLRMTWGICSGEEPKGPLVTHRRGSRGLLDKGDIWKVSINRFSKHHFFPPSQTQNFAWYFRKFVLSSANTRVNFTNSCFLKLREDTIFDHSLH